MTIVEQILKRRSVRAYTGEPLQAADLSAIKTFIDSTQPPWGVQARIAIVHSEPDSNPRKLGSYGTVRGACDFMGLVYKDGPLAIEASAYWFEQVVLHCTGLGLGTVWLAGFTSSSFLDAVSGADGEKVRYASPVGYAGGSKSMMERLGIVNSDRLHNNKKPFGTLFLHEDFATPLTEAEAGPLVEPLRMTRLTPSASNRQPYRVVVTGGVAHFYTPHSRLAHTDVGIALAHFDLTAKELGIAGELKVLNDYRSYPGFDYVMSWIS